MCTEASKSKKERQPCTHNHVVVPLAMLAQYSGVLGSRTLALAGQTSFEDFNYRKWLGQVYYQRLYGIRATNAIAVVDLIAQSYIE